MTDVPLLTVDLARFCLAGVPAETYAQHFELAEAYDAALEAIATERARVCPARSEAEWVSLCAQASGGENDYAINLDGWLSLARHLGLVSGEQGGG